MLFHNLYEGSGGPLWTRIDLETTIRAPLWLAQRYQFILNVGSTFIIVDQDKQISFVLAKVLVVTMPKMVLLIKNPIREAR